MRGWLDPIGPEPSGTYWIRRGIVVVVIVALVASVVWLFTRPRGSVDVAASSATPGKTPTPTRTHDTAGPATPTPSPDASPAQSSEPGAPVSSAEPVASEQPTPTPDPEAPCRPQALTLRVAGPDPVSGANPAVFNVVVTTSQAQCLLDLGAAQAAMVVTSGNDRIWATSDCPEWQPQGVLQLSQGQEAGFEVSWPVRRSKGCELVETPLGAGTYVATATIGSASARHVMLLQG